MSVFIKKKIHPIINYSRNFRMFKPVCLKREERCLLKVDKLEKLSFKKKKNPSFPSGELVKDAPVGEPMA